LIDTGFNLVFCDGNSQIIPIPSITKTIFTKGNEDTLFSENNKYYALKMDGYSLIIDDSINGSLTYDGIELDCNSGKCTVVFRVCYPESTNSNDHNGCNDGYYLISNHLYSCSNKYCERKDIVGYFDNVTSNNYIKCTSNGSEITCDELIAPTESNNVCINASDLLYVNGEYIKLCLDSSTENAIEIFKEDNSKYFIQGNVLNTSLSNNKYYIISVSENAVMILTGQKRYQYTFNNKKIISHKNQCSSTQGETEQDLVEYTKVASTNEYIKSN